MTSHVRFPRVLITAVVATSLALVGCSRNGDNEAGGDPGITDDSVAIAISNPLSGPAAGPGRCVADGVVAYFEARNAEGGIEFGDGKTRTVTVDSLDDAYNPQQAKANYDASHNEVFVMGLGLGTPTNRAWRDAAIEDGVPQVLTQTGDPLFSDTEESPWQLDAFPTYVSEGRAFGELLASHDQEYDIAVLVQNDDYGLDYLTGLQEAVAESTNLTIVKELTYEATDDSIEAQITELAQTGADVMFNAVAQPPLTISGLLKAQDLGWEPIWFLPSNTSSVEAILKPGNATAFPAIYTASYQKSPEDPAYANDEDVVEFLDALAQYTDQPDIPEFPHCMWGYMTAAILEEAFRGTTEPTRENFMTALRSISGFEPPLALPGTTVDTTIENAPAISEVILEEFDGEAYVPVTSP